MQVDTRKATALLAVLAVEGRRPREHLATLLWPESDEVRARGALRRTLSVLTSGLSGDWIRADRQTIELCGDPAIDVRRADELEQRITSASGEDCRPVLDELVALHRGPFLDGFTLRDAAEFDVWRCEEAERRRRQLVVALDRKSELEAAAADLEAALETLHRWRDEEPLNELVHRRLILLHGRRGDRLSAVHVYRECVAVLERELGVAPLDATTEAYQAVVSGRALRTRQPRPRPRATREPVAPAPTAPGTWRSAPRSRRELPLVGRDADLDRVVAHLDRPGAVVVVEGEAGIGKTRFMEEVEAHLHRSDVPVLTGRCHRGEGHLALGPIMEILRDLSRRPEARQRLESLEEWQRAELSRLLPELAPTPGTLTSVREEARTRFLDALATTLDTLASPAGAPAVLLLEDVHLADSGTRDLLAYTAHRLDQWRLRMVVSRRDADDDHGGVWTDPTLGARLLRSELGRLSERDVLELCTAALGPSSQAITQRLWTEAAGLPLAVVQYLAWILEDGGSTAHQDGPWPLPAGLRDVVAERVADLDDTVSQVAGALAVLSHGVDLPLLVDVSGRSEDETVAALDDLLDRGVAALSRDGTFELSHEWLRTIVYEASSPARRRLLHARVVSALTTRATGRRGGRFAARIAEHARAAGLREEAADWSLRAGDHALSLFANEEALEHFEAALALGPTAPAAVHARIARVHVLAGDYEAALTAYETAAAMADDDAELTRIEHELGALHVRRREWAAARLHLEAALAGGGDIGTGRMARIRADVGLTALQRGDLDEAESHARTALTEAESVQDREAIAQARNLAGMIQRRRGAWEEAMVHLEHAAALAAHLRDPSAYIAALNNLALTTAMAGDVERAQELLRTALARCERQGDRHRQAALLNNLADLHHHSGDDAGAHTHLVQAVTLFEAIGRDTGDGAPDPEVWKLVEW